MSAHSQTWCHQFLSFNRSSSGRISFNFILRPDIHFFYQIFIQLCFGKVSEDLERSVEPPWRPGLFFFCTLLMGAHGWFLPFPERQARPQEKYLLSLALEKELSFWIPDSLTGSRKLRKKNLESGNQSMESKRRSQTANPLLSFFLVAVCFHLLQLHPSPALIPPIQC